MSIESGQRCSDFFDLDRMETENDNMLIKINEPYCQESRLLWREGVRVLKS